MLITAERDCITYKYNLLLLYTNLYTLTRIALENENLYSKESNTSAHNTDIGDNLNYKFEYDYSDYYAHRLYKKWSKNHALTAGHYITPDYYSTGISVDTLLAILKDRITGEDRIPAYSYAFIVQKGQYTDAPNSLPGNIVAPLDGKPGGGIEYINTVTLIWFDCEPLE